MRPLAGVFPEIDTFTVQETMRASDVVDDTVASLNSAGFHALVNLASRADVDGLIAGSAVLSKWHCGIIRVRFRDMQLPGPLAFLGFQGRCGRQRWELGMQPLFF